MEPERRLDDDAEGAERAGQELRDVVAGHRLDDLGAAPRRRAVRLDEAGTEQEIPPRAVAEAPLAAGIRREHAAHGARAAAVGVQRQHLPVLAQLAGQQIERDARLHRRHHVGGDVLENAPRAARGREPGPGGRAARRDRAPSRCPAGRRPAPRRMRGTAPCRPRRANPAEPASAGVTPSIAAAASSDGAVVTCSPPTMAAMASPSAREPRRATLRPRCRPEAGARTA